MVVYRAHVCNFNGTNTPNRVDETRTHLVRNGAGLERIVFGIEEAT